MVEKPKTKEEVLSLYSILGRCVLTPDIFDILDNTAPGAGGEIQLTDAIQKLNEIQRVFAYDFEGKRYDVGEKLGFIQTTLEFAMQDDELKDSLIPFMQDLLAKEEV